MVQEAALSFTVLPGFERANCDVSLEEGWILSNALLYEKDEEKQKENITQKKIYWGMGNCRNNRSKEELFCWESNYPLPFRVKWSHLRNR